MADLADHAANRNNWFTVVLAPLGARVPGYAVVNLRTGLTAVHPSGRRYWGLSAAEASQVCVKLNRRAQQKRICKGCRHKRYADEIVEGRCAQCRRTESTLTTP